MIYGTIQNWEKEAIYFPLAFSKALSFLKDNDLSKLDSEKYAIDGDTIFALVQDVVTEPTHMRRFELHREYIDIQYLISGREQQLYAPMSVHGATLLEDSLADSDIAFYTTPSKYTRIHLEAGDYAIYLPGELHCPCCAVETADKIQKIVFKIRKMT